MVDQLEIKTKIQLIDLKTYLNSTNHIALIMQGKYAWIGGSQGFDIITQFINQRYSIPFHLLEQKAFLSFLAIAMRKSLPKQLTHQIIQM